MQETQLPDFPEEGYDYRSEKGIVEVTYLCKEVQTFVKITKSRKAISQPDREFSAHRWPKRFFFGR